MIRSKITPCRNICLITEPDRRLTDPLQIAFYSIKSPNYHPGTVGDPAGTIQLNSINKRQKRSSR
jgi:hypothetical protein